MSQPKQKINQNATIQKVINESKKFLEKYKNAAKNSNVSISTGNGKLGSIGNISTPPIITCGSACGSCMKYCYAVRAYLKYGFERKDKKLNPWLVNYCIFLIDPDRYFYEISRAVYVYRFFRWHVSGDIINKRYFEGMVKVAVENPHCEFLAFTKQYDIVNAFIEENSIYAIPKNLHLLFSAAPGLEMKNPHNMPECHINFENQELNTFKGCAGNVYHCSGNCSECIANNCGCFYLNNNDVTIINQH